MVEIKKTGERVETIRDYEVSSAGPLPATSDQPLRWMPDKAQVVFREGTWAWATLAGEIVENGKPTGLRCSNDYESRDALPEWAVPLTRYEED